MRKHTAIDVFIFGHGGWNARTRDWFIRDLKRFVLIGNNPRRRYTVFSRFRQFFSLVPGLISEFRIAAIFARQPIYYVASWLQRIRSYNSPARYAGFALLHDFYQRLLRTCMPLRTLRKLISICQNKRLIEGLDIRIHEESIPLMNEFLTSN